MSEELLDLARKLRRRVEQSHRSEWKVEAVDNGASPPPTEPTPSPSGRASGLRPPCGGAKVSLGGTIRSSGASKRLDELAAEVRACRRCPLGAARLNAAPGVGSYEARVAFVGEGPGFSEDHKGEPFVGRAGELLDKILAAIGLSRRTVYITNVVKCHPMKDPKDPEARGNDRQPTPEEAAACRPYLDEQLRLISPRFIVTLGAVATRELLGGDAPIGKVRGRWHDYAAAGFQARLLPTFHPAALLRDPSRKKDVWEDMKSLRRALDETG